MSSEHNAHILYTQKYSQVSTTPIYHTLKKIVKWAQRPCIIHSKMLSNESSWCYTMKNLLDCKTSQL